MQMTETQRRTVDKLILSKGVAADVFKDFTKYCGLLENHHVARATKEIVLLAGQHFTLCVDECNGTAKNFDAVEKDIKAAIVRQVAILQQQLDPNVEENKVHGARIALGFNGDPRGFTIRLHFPNRYKNNWGNGYGIAHARN